MPAHKLTNEDIIGRKIKAAIAKKGLTQTKFAKQMNVDQSTVSKWISDYNRIRMGDLKRMCSILSIAPMEFFEEVKS